jgi:hypothetical protein
VYVKLGKTREVQVSFVKSGRLERGHCFPAIEVLLALYNFLLCTACKSNAKKKICQLVISLLVLSICVSSVQKGFTEPFWVKNLCHSSILVQLIFWLYFYLVVMVNFIWIPFISKFLSHLQVNLSGLHCL